MIAQWIAYSIASSLLLGLAALALEKGLGRRWAVLRSLWAAALLGSMVCATLPWILPEQTRGTAVESRPLLLWSAPSPSTSSAPIEAVATAVPSASPSPVSLLGAPDLAELDPLLRYLCLLASGWLAIAIGLSLRTISRERRSWRRGSVEGVPAYISAAFGPAVVGLFRTMIVLPEWVLTMDATQRSLVVTHEEEHLRGGDPLLVAFCLLVAVAMPWNPAIWWQIRRLRHAIELDCDARVLKRRPDVRAYGSLLMDLGHRGTPRSLLTSAFSESSSLLERRIERIVTTSTRARTGPLVGMLGIAAVLVVVTLQLPRPLLAQPEVASSARVAAPTPTFRGLPAAPVLEVVRSTDTLEPDVAEVGTAAAEQLVITQAAPDTLQARFEPGDLAALAAAEYPAALRESGIEGEATLRFVVDREGRARDVEVLAQNRLEFAEAAGRVVARLAFWPATVDGVSIESTVPAFRVRFRLSREAAPERREPGSVEVLLRAAITEHYPELLAGATARTPYVYLVVNEGGEVLKHALEWARPSTPAIREAILQRFPDLPTSRSALQGGAGSSVRTGIPGSADIEVFWATLLQSTTADVPIAWGRYPLAAVSPASAFPHAALLDSLRQRHQVSLREGIPAGNSIWYVASAAGDLLETGIAADSAVYARARALDPTSAFLFMSIFAAEDGQRVRVLGSVLEARPEERGVVAGRVTDAAGNPVAGAVVLFRDRQQGAVTRANGEYALIAVPPGRHTLIVRHPSGNSEVTGEVVVAADRGATADFTLR